MSILSKIMGRKNEETKTANQEAAQAVTADVAETVQDAHEEVATVAATVAATVEVDQIAKPVEGDAKESCGHEGCDHDHASPEFVETIALGDDELKALNLCRYETIKDRFTKTFVIEKHFFARIQNPEHQSQTKVVRVRRVAELKASSLNHALSMIGWDDRNIQVASVRDDYDGTISIKVDGKDIGVKIQMSKPNDLFSQYEKMSAGQKKIFVDTIRGFAVANDKVQEILCGKKPRIVVGCSYEHNKHINLKTAKGKPAPITQVPSEPNVVADEKVGMTDALIETAKAVVEAGQEVAFVADESK